MKNLFLDKGENGFKIGQYSIKKTIIYIIGGLILSLIIIIVLSLIFSSPNYDKFGAYVSVPNSINLTYRTGNCLGYINNYWDDAKNSFLAAKAGLNTQRKKLPENHLENWGYGIEIGDCKENEKLGIKQIVAYLARPSNSHSIYKNDSAEFHPPLNLYEEIWNDNGTVNKNNYWAYYVYQVVQNYKDYVNIYEVWNEPDYTRNYGVIDLWYKEPPNATDLSFWNSNIFEYIRILRVTYEVVKKYHPEAFVATGGLGYDSFLDCIMRYSDNPDGGKITKKYPSYGGAYFDCHAFHKYPKYGTYDIQKKKNYNKIASDNFALNMMALKRNHEYIISKYGFDGKKYPQKIYICTESGVDSTGQYGSDLIRRNFNLKAPLYAIENDIKQLHYFVTADGNKEGNGDYLPGISSKTKENYQDLMKPSTKARLVLNHFNIYKMEFDNERTQKLRKDLPANVTGIVLKKKFEPDEGEFMCDYLYAIWVECLENETNDTIEVELNFNVKYNKMDYFIKNSTFGKSGKANITNTPIFFYNIEKENSSNFKNLIVILIIFGSIGIGIGGFFAYKFLSKKFSKS